MKLPPLKYVKPLSYVLDMGATTVVCLIVTGDVIVSVALGVAFVIKQNVFNHYLQLSHKNRIRKLEGGLPPR